MSVIDQKLNERSGSKCELCGSKDDLRIHLTKEESISLDNSVLVCATCKNQIENTTTTDPNHWRCLSDSMWNENKPVQVVAWRMLNRLRAEGWPQDLLDMMYLDEETLVWAGATGEGDDEGVSGVWVSDIVTSASSRSRRRRSRSSRRSRSRNSCLPLQPPRTGDLPGGKRYVAVAL